MRASVGKPRMRVLLIGLLSIPACGRDVAFVDPQAAGQPGDSTTGGEQSVVRGSLEITVAIADDDSAIAAAVGLAGPGLPGASVRVSRPGQSSQEAVTDGSGRVRFADLVTGGWAVSVVRSLTAVERAGLPAGAEDIAGFAGGGPAQVIASGSSVTVEVVLGRQGGVIISEVYAPIVQTPGGQYYYAGQYVDLYNNGFDVAHLDGMVLGLIYFIAVETQISTCEQSAVWREDSLGLWVQYFSRFPGSGTDYPLAPGATAVVAMDAIDHRPFVPGLLDLSSASFEFLGSADVDNPAVPNMLDIGFAEFASGLGHGIRFGPDEVKPFLSAPFDPDTLEQDVDRANQRHVRIPRGAVLDVFTSRATPELEAARFLEPCSRLVHEVFDRTSANLYDYRQLLGLRRRVLEVLGDGRVILQRTGSSDGDLELTEPTPGRVP